MNISRMNKPGASDITAVAAGAAVLFAVIGVTGDGVWQIVFTWGSGYFAATALYLFFEQQMLARIREKFRGDVEELVARAEAAGYRKALDVAQEAPGGEKS